MIAASLYFWYKDNLEIPLHGLHKIVNGYIILYLIQCVRIMLCIQPCHTSVSPELLYPYTTGGTLRRALEAHY